MRKHLILAVALCGLGLTFIPVANSAPVASVTAIEPLDPIEQVKKGGYKFKGHKGWKHSRHWNRGHGYGRYYNGPPPHARAYGRRARDFGHYRYYW